uniref:p0460E08.2 protein n=1 Tax=Oryza sativa subsp. japonica TaxID=39947 RepID=Q94DU1_ORYSJ|nr:P0460E08.2 [Oryza sativa Japonica Group]
MRADRLMAEGGKRIDLGAPLRSVRHADALPYHKADLNSGPVRHPGAVPFVWEQRPGQPKSVRTRRAPPSPTTASHPQPLEHGVEDEIDGSPYHDALGEHYVGILHGVDASPACSRTGAPAPAPARDEKRAQVAEAAVLQAKKEVTEKQVVSVAAVLRKGDDDDDDEERFSDALDTLSRTESFTVNCSVSGLSGMPEPTSRAAAGAEAGVRGIMMDRFLPAAQAVAIGSPQYTFRKAGAASATSNSGRELARAAGSNASGSSGDDPGRRTPQSWEDVYKHKLEQKYVRPGEDGRSKLTSESNQLTFWSDSQAGNGSSPFHHSAGGGLIECRTPVLGVARPKREFARKFPPSITKREFARKFPPPSLGLDLLLYLKGLPHGPNNLT